MELTVHEKEFFLFVFVNLLAIILLGLVIVYHKLEARDKIRVCLSRISNEKELEISKESPVCKKDKHQNNGIKTLETINTRFPPEKWLHIYTDGSLLDFAQGAGIGVFSHLFFYLHAGPLTTHFDGEVEATLVLSERASTSALQALSNYNENNCLRVQNCRELLGKIKGKIVFQWVPSHCGLWGNERADF
ncbi:uncharacterized protein TNCV_4311282 [Trichonephila clavipes]|nr:uncharacterized protein TNCV_4311282 [Trichonephila clavipes]